MCLLSWGPPHLNRQFHWVSYPCHREGYEPTSTTLEQLLDKEGNPEAGGMRPSLCASLPVKPACRKRVVGKLCSKSLIRCHKITLQKWHKYLNGSWCFYKDTCALMVLPATIKLLNKNANVRVVYLPRSWPERQAREVPTLYRLLSLSPTAEDTTCSDFGRLEHPPGLKPGYIAPSTVVSRQCQRHYAGHKAEPIPIAWLC